MEVQLQIHSRNNFTNLHQSQQQLNQQQISNIHFNNSVMNSENGNKNGFEADPLTGSFASSSSNSSVSPIMENLKNTGSPKINTNSDAYFYSNLSHHYDTSAHMNISQTIILDAVVSQFSPNNHNRGTTSPNSIKSQNGFTSCMDNSDNIHNKLMNQNACNMDRKRPYPCDLCASKFGSKMELEEHQNSHTGMKPFQCDICQSRFNRRSTLWNHKRIHSDAKPFVCTVCQMTFKWKNSLKCHKDMHLRKNETNAVHDDIRQLTYATAAKKRLNELGEHNSNASNNLTCAGTPRKRALPRSQQKMSPSLLKSHQILDMKSHSQQNPQQQSVIFSPKKIKNEAQMDLETNRVILESITLNNSDEFGQQNFDKDKNNYGHSPNGILVPSPQHLKLNNGEISRMSSINSPTMSTDFLINHNINNNCLINSTNSLMDSSIGSNLNNQNLGFNSTREHLQNGCGLEKMSSFFDHTNTNPSLLPFFNIDIQNLNNPLIGESQHLQHSSASPFDSFSMLQNSTQQQHQQQTTSFNLNLNNSNICSSSPNSLNATNSLLASSLSQSNQQPQHLQHHSNTTTNSAEMLFNNYPVGYCFYYNIV